MGLDFLILLPLLFLSLSQLVLVVMVVRLLVLGLVPCSIHLGRLYFCRRSLRPSSHSKSSCHPGRYLILLLLRSLNNWLGSGLPQYLLLIRLWPRLVRLVPRHRILIHHRLLVSRSPRLKILLLLLGRCPHDCFIFIKDILLVKDGMAEFMVVDSVCEERLYSVLDQGQRKHFIDIRSHPLIGVEELPYQLLEPRRKP